LACTAPNTVEHSIETLRKQGITVSVIWITENVSIDFEHKHSRKRLARHWFASCGDAACIAVSPCLRSNAQSKSKCQPTADATRSGFLCFAHEAQEHRRRWRPPSPRSWREQSGYRLYPFGRRRGMQHSIDRSGYDGPATATSRHRVVSHPAQRVTGRRSKAERACIYAWFLPSQVRCRDTRRLAFDGCIQCRRLRSH
jgi:hypothetical protein